MNLRMWLALLAVVAGANDGWAWGATGHEWISGIAIEKLPDSVPAFVHTPEAAAEIAVLGRELDRLKGAGRTHDAERDPGHYVDAGAKAVAALDLGPRRRPGSGLVAATHR